MTLTVSWLLIVTEEHCTYRRNQAEIYQTTKQLIINITQHLGKASFCCVVPKRRKNPEDPGSTTVNWIQKHQFRYYYFIFPRIGQHWQYIRQTFCNAHIIARTTTLWQLDNCLWTRHVPTRQGCSGGEAWGTDAPVNTSEGSGAAVKCSRYQLNVTLCSSVWYSSDNIRQNSHISKPF